MRLTNYTDYTLRVLIYLALQPERRATIAEISAAYGISSNHLMKIVHHLGRDGVIDTVRGKTGGLKLGHPPETIGLGAVVRACEGTSPFVECLGEGAAECRIAPNCRLAGILAEAAGAMYATLDRYTLADLVKRPEGLRQILKLKS